MLLSSYWPLLLLLALPSFGHADNLMLYTLDAPPLTYLKAEPGYGLVGDVVMAAIAQAGDHVELPEEPWARAQKTVSEGHNLIIIPLSRTPAREKLFTWITPIMRMDRAFFSLQHRVNSYAEAKASYRMIGVGLGSAQHEILLSEGFNPKQIQTLKIGENPATMLERGRIDAWFNGVPESLFIWSQHNRQGTPLLMSPPLSSIDLYLACPKHCDTALIKRLRSAVKTLQADGTAQRLQANPRYAQSPSAITAQ